MAEAATSAATSGKWLAAMDAVAEDDGYLEPLGKRHWAFFAEAGPVLLVTFERAEAVRARPGKMPEAWGLCRKNGWSLLTVLAEGETFWRAPEVWGYFDRLVDDAFFDDFDRVLFFGADAGGYAAAAYVVTAPGARALLVSPRATMAPEIAGWDWRHRAARRFDYTSRYGYAPDMTEGASRVWLVHDPLHLPDAAHAALFRRPWVTQLRARRAGEATVRVLGVTGVLDPLIEEAMAGTLTVPGFARRWRARRGYPVYLRTLLLAAQAMNRPGLERLVCRNVTGRMHAPRFAKRLAELEQG